MSSSVSSVTPRRLLSNGDIMEQAFVDGMEVEDEFHGPSEEEEKFKIGISVTSCYRVRHDSNFLLSICGKV